MLNASALAIGMASPTTYDISRHDKLRLAVYSLR
jgi:hypothetical protein